eukprot:4026201-Pleurochrysis_carterae.AAC.1
MEHWLASLYLLIWPGCACPMLFQDVLASPARARDCATLLCCQTLALLTLQRLGAHALALRRNIINCLLCNVSVGYLSLEVARIRHSVQKVVLRGWNRPLLCVFLMKAQGGYHRVH